MPADNSQGAGMSIGPQDSSSLAVPNIADAQGMQQQTMPPPPLNPPPVATQPNPSVQFNVPADQLPSFLTTINHARAEERTNANKTIAQLQQELNEMRQRLQSVQQPDFDKVKDPELRDQLKSIQQQLQEERNHRETLERQRKASDYRQQVLSFFKPGEVIPALVRGDSVEEINRSVEVAVAEANRLRALYQPPVVQQAPVVQYAQQPQYVQQPPQPVPTTSQNAYQQQAMPQQGPTATSPVPPTLAPNDANQVLQNAQFLTSDAARRSGEYFKNRQQLMSALRQSFGDQGPQQQWALQPQVHNQMNQPPAPRMSSFAQPSWVQNQQPPQPVYPQNQAALQYQGQYYPQQHAVQAPSPYPAQAQQPQYVQQQMLTPGQLQQQAQAAIEARRETGQQTLLNNPTAHPQFRNDV